MMTLSFAKKCTIDGSFLKAEHSGKCFFKQSPAKSLRERMPSELTGWQEEGMG